MHSWITLHLEIADMKARNKKLTKSHSKMLTRKMSNWYKKFDDTLLHESEYITYLNDHAYRVYAPDSTYKDSFIKLVNEYAKLKPMDEYYQYQIWRLRSLAEENYRHVSLPLNQKAPDFDFIDKDGAVRKISTYRGKVVFLAFWSPNFLYYKKGFDHLNQIIGSAGSENLNIVTIPIGESDAVLEYSHKYLSLIHI